MQVKERYRPVQIDGYWFVMDLKHPEAEPYSADDEEDARLSARIWNLLCTPGVYD